MDLASGYWQVAMLADAKWKAAFVTHEGLYQFQVIPFGLCNALDTFERLMDCVLCGMRWSRCLVYLDDVQGICMPTCSQIPDLQGPPASSVFMGQSDRATARIRPSGYGYRTADTFTLNHSVNRVNF